MSSIKVVAFDLGNVIVRSDFSKLNEYERFCLNICQNQYSKDMLFQETLKFGFKSIESAKLVAFHSIVDIYKKMYVFSDQGIEALEYVKKVDLIPAIWTNHIWELYGWLSWAHFYQYVEMKYICNSIALGNGNVNKPDILFYKLALEFIKFQKEEILFIDDNIQNVLSARKYGIFSVPYSLCSKNEYDLQEVVHQSLERKGL